MKRIFFAAIFSMLACMLSAQDMYVYSVIGQAEKQVNGEWQLLQKRDKLSGSDIVRVSDNSALSVLDRTAEKLYSFSQTNSKKLSELIANYKGKQNYSANFVAHASKSLFNGGSDRISNDAAGCTYRGDIIENDIAKALIYKAQGVSFNDFNNAKTDYAISFDILDRNTLQPVEGSIKANSQAIVRIKNKSDMALYVNILDFDQTSNEKAVCLPIDDATTLSHLLIPAHCTIDLTTFPIGFYEPKGLNNLVLVAAEVPYDLRQVSKYLDKADVKNIQASKYPVGVYAKDIIIK